MKLPLNKKWFLELIAAMFILLFAYTAFSKLLNIESFKWVLKTSPLVGEKGVLMAYLIPTVEIIIAALLFFPKTRRIGLLASFSLMLIFTLYIAYMIMFTPSLPCSCGGVISKMTWRQHLTFNIFFTLLGLYGWILERRRRKFGRTDPSAGKYRLNTSL